MEKEYYIVVDNNRVGPLSMSQLSQRGIEPSTLVWTAGYANWVRADCMPELAPLLANRTSMNNPGAASAANIPPVANTQPTYQQPSNNPYNNGYNNGGYNNNGYNNNGYNGGNQNWMNNTSQPSTNWKTVAIVATVCGFLFSCIGGIFGIIGITQGAKAEEAMRMGDEFTSQNCWSRCKTMCIISFILSGIGLIANIVLLSGGLY